MRIDKAKCKKILTEVPASCRGLITKLKTCPESELVNTLKEITVWEYGKCELYHWIDVLDRFDAILERVAKPEAAPPNEMMIYLCRKLEEKQSKHLVYYVLYFTALLMEHAYARHLYSSIEHLTNLLAASDMDIVLAVLNLLYVFSKRSNFISRLTPERRSSLKLRLNHLAESWGGKDNGFGLAACCEDKPLSEFPPTATTLHYEFYILGSNGASSHKVIHKEHLDTYSDSSARIMEDLVTSFQVPTGKQMGLLTHIRLAQAFSNYTRRLQCVQARLQAISILVYSNAGNDILQNLLYDGLIEELVDVLGVSDHRLTDIKAAALRTLTAIIHLERTPRINAIIDATGMSSYHGFFPSLFRSCVLAMIGESKETPLPQTLSTALFSFLYHLASYESGGEALVSCGIMETLLRIVQWKSLDNSQLTFVTRAVRLVDLITNMDITTFTNFSGLSCLIARLDHEVNKCRDDLGEARVLHESPTLEEIEGGEDSSPSGDGESSSDPVSLDVIEVAMTAEPTVPAQDVDMTDSERASSSKCGKGPSKSCRSMCIPQRAALLKSVLNFLKKSIPDPLFSDYIRNVMDGSLPSSLKHIISKAEYYGPSLFLLATEVVTLYVFHEPSLLSSLQDRKLTDVILEALVVKEVPPTREVIASLPNILSALCLNQRGLEAFIQCKPFDRLFHVLLSPQYLPAMRRRSSDSLGDTATNLGTAMDELMRHQPTLRHDAMTAIIKLLKEVCIMGEDENVIVQNMSLSGELADRGDEKGDGSDEDDEVVMRRAKVSAENSPAEPLALTGTSSSSTSPTKQSLPLMEYVYNVVRFIDAILSNNATDDHCKEFVKQGGLEPLIKIPSLPNIAIQFASSRACMDVAITLKDILTLSQDGTVIVQCFNQIDQLIKQLEPMYNPTSESYLVNELSRSATPTQPYHSAKSTPLLHTITALESYTTLLISLCKVGQVDMRTVCIAKWGSDQGLAIINKLSHLYSAIVWENDLLGLLSPPYNHTQGRGDLEKLIEVIGPNPVIKLKGKERKDKSPPHIRLIKPLWQSVDRLRKHLAAFLTVLCKLSCGHTRVRRTMGNKPVPSTHQCDIAKHIIKFVVNGLTWRPPNIPNIHPRVSLMAMIDHIGLAGQILYSESQQPYHLMLLEFDRAQGLQALVGTYEWSASIPKQDNKDLVPGSGEFMVAWLTLIKKLIDVKQVIESSHSLPSQTVPPSNQYKQFEFEPVHFLAKSHKFAFEVISQLWDELYAYSGMKTLKNEIGPITEHVIVILKHLLKGDLQDKIQKLDKKNEDGTSSTSINESSVQPSEHLVQQLMDMGFARQHAVEALIHSNNNMTAATEYVLTRPSLSIPMPDSDLSEEEAMMQAIAMSLAVEEEGAHPAEEKEPEEPQPEIEYVTEDKLWSLYDKILAGCIKLLEDVPSAVFKIGDLLAVIMDRKGDMSRADTISRILPLVVEGVKHVIECLSESNYSSQINNKRIAVLGAYLHCLLLISEDLMFSCGELFSETKLFNDHLVTLLRLYANHLVKEGSTDSKPPGWLTPLILLFDVHEKMATMVKRRSNLPKVEHVWQYYEERHNRWVNYHTSSNATIEKAYLAGEQEVCFNSGRRHYMVLFNIMTQINEENGAPRPVMRIPKPGLLPSPSEPSTSGATEPPAVAAEQTSPHKDKKITGPESGKDKSLTPAKKDDLMEAEDMAAVEHFDEVQISDIVVLCTKILGHIQDADAVQALMRLLLRFTRNHRQAQLFAENNGLHHVMQLKEGSSFTGFSSLSTLIFRHLLEDERTLKCTVENTVLGYLAGTVTDESNETRTSGNIKEIHNMLQRLAPVASRAERIFSETCQTFLRFTVPPNLKESIKTIADVNDLSSILKEPYTIKASSEKPEEYSTVSPLAAMAISSLLGRLTVLFHTSEENLPKLPDRTDTAELKVSSQELLSLEEPSPFTSSDPVRAPKKRRKTGHSEQKEKAKLPGTKKFLVTQSSILKMLSEAVKSYSGVAEFIIDQTVLNKEGESTYALTFIMDNLLAAPGKDAPPGREDTHEHAKMILSTVAASNSSDPAKEKLVDQIRLSFISSLNTLESPAKHAKVQAIASLMSIILDPRGPYNLPVMVDSFNLNSSISSQSPPYISKLLIAKGLVSDLAQVPHKLDLSSPHMALTINMCLKPLEVLTRLIYSAVLAESSQTTDKSEDPDKQDRDRTRGEVEETLGDLILNNVVDQLLDGTLPASSANILGSSSQEDMDTMDVISRPIPISNEGTSWSGRPDRLVAEEDEDEEDRREAAEEPAVRSSPNHASSSFIQALQGLGEPFTNQQGYSGDGDEDEGDSFSDEEDGDDDDDDGDDDDDDDDDDEEEDRLGNNPEDEDDHGVDDTVDEADANMVDEDEGSDMEVDDDDDEDDVDMELDDTSNLVFDTTRADNFNLDFLNDEEEQFVAVMNTSRLNSARTHFRWSNHSPLARARARANGSTSSGLPTSHPLLMRNSDISSTTDTTSTTAAGTSGTVTSTARIPRLLDSDTGAPFLHRLLNSGADAVLLGSSRSRNSRVHVFDQVTRDEILNSDLNDFNPVGGNSETVLTLPSALSRWREEAQVLDGSSLQDLVQLVKPPVISTLSRHMDAEVSVIKEARLKELNEELAKEAVAAKKREEEAERTAKEAKEKATTGEEEGGEEDSTTPSETSPSDDLGPLLSSSLNMASNTASEASSGGDEVTPGNEPITSATTRAITTSSLNPTPGEGSANQVQDPDDSMPDMFPEDSDSSLTSVGSSVGWTPPQSTTGPEQGSTATDRPSPSYSPMSETNPLVPTAGLSNTADVMSASDDVMSTGDVTSSSSVVTTSAVTPVSSAITEVTSLASEVAASISALRGTVPAPEPTNETSAQTDTTPVNAIYIDGIPVPEGIDPSFLEALPDSIRMEVLLEQSAALERQRRVAAQQRATTTEPQPSGTVERTDSAYNPSDVLMSLPSSLRRSVLADMEESQLNSLSEDLVQDYERIRSEQRARTVYTTIPSSAGGTSRAGGSARSLLSRLNNLVNFRTLNIGGEGRSGTSNRASIGPIFASTIPPFPPVSGLSTTGNTYKHEIKRSAQLQEEVRKVIKKKPIEHEAITCLLVLLFIDDSLRLQTSRLHRVLRNLCCNTASRTWVLISLISIIQKCSAAKKTNKASSKSPASLLSSINCQNSWLTLSMNTSLGCKNNVFDINASSKGQINSQEVIKIHPQASTVVCRRVLDLLVALGRYFPNHFLSRSVTDSGLKYGGNKLPDDKKAPQAELLNTGLALTDFWDFLLSSDQVKGKTPSGKSTKMGSSSHFLSCPMGQLMVLLDHPVIKNNQNLIDRLLRLLSSIAHALAEQTSDKKEDKKSKNVEPLPEDCPENSIEKQHLQLVTSILTTGACSEEGLEDGTSLLLQLSKVNSRLRDMTLSLMLSGLQSVAADLQQQIKQLLEELKEEHRRNPQKKQKEKDVTKSKALTLQPNKGSLKTPHRDLHLPAMSNLTKKNSSQAYFLRILKVVIAVRDVTIKSIEAEKDKKKKEREAKVKEEKEKKRKEREEQRKEGEETESDDEEDEEETKNEEEEDKTGGLGPLSEQLKVSQLWTTLGECLSELGSSSDTHAVLVLQPAVEAFFHVHGIDSTAEKTSSASRRGRNTSGSLDLLSESPAPLSVEPVDSVSSLSSGGQGSLPIFTSDMCPDTRKFITFAEQHRIVLNQILRQSTTPLSDGPFQVLVNHTRVLDFDVKRRYFRQELDKIEETNRREDIAIRVRREHVFEESFRELHRRSPEELKSRLYVIFEGEEGQDAGGLLREWYQIIAREIFNPHYALFTTTPGDKVTYVCNSFSHYNPNHLDYFKFVGRVIAKAIYDNKHLDCYFSRSFYKHILGQPISFKDMEHEDYAFYKSMMFLLEHDLVEAGLDNLDFTMEIEEFGVSETRELKPNGDNIAVTNSNKKEYVKLISQMKMTGSIRSQIKAFLDGFYDIIPKHLISIFSDNELELLISGLPTIDIEDLKANTEYHKFSVTSLQIQWFWRALRSFSQAERANFLQFVTGTSKVPLQGFSSLEGMNGVQKFQIHRDDRSTDRLPSAHTCFNQLDLPVYETYDKLRRNLLLAINECPEGFGLA